MITIQPLASQDAPAVAAMREAASAHKGEILGPEGRPMFDTMLAATPAAEAVRLEPGRAGGISGWWCRWPAYHPAAEALEMAVWPFAARSAQLTGLSP
jgi:epsilon-lactone hydrolase